MKTLISADNVWALWAVLTGIAAFSIWAEQKYQWASKVTGCVLALAIAMLFSNLKIIPVDAPTYDQVWDYVVPLAIPMLLFNFFILWNILSMGSLWQYLCCFSMPILKRYGKKVEDY